MWGGMCFRAVVHGEEQVTSLPRGRMLTTRPPHSPALPPSRVAAEEEEAAMAERRQDLFTLFRNTASLARTAAYSFVGGRLSAAVGGGAAWQDVEVAVSLLYQLGEGAPEADTKPGSGVLAQLAAGIMATEVRAGAGLGRASLWRSHCRCVMRAAPWGGRESGCLGCNSCSALLMPDLALFVAPTRAGPRRQAPPGGPCAA